MNIFKTAFKIMTFSIFLLGTVICLSAFDNFQPADNQREISTQEPNATISVPEQIEILTNSTNESERWQAVVALRQAADSLANDVLEQALLNDTSYTVRISCIYAQKAIEANQLSELLETKSETDNSIKTEKEITTIRKKYKDVWKKLFNPSYTFNCEFPDEIKALAANSIGNLDDINDAPIFLEELKKNCEFPYAKRQQRVHRPGGGDYLSSVLTALLSRPITVRMVSPNKLVYQHVRNKEMIPLFTKEMAKSTGDYKYCLIIILNNLTGVTDFSIEEMKNVPVYEFDKDLLPQCEEGLLKTESPAIKQGLIKIIKANNYVPKSSEAQKAMDDFIAETEKQRNFETRAGGRG